MEPINAPESIDLIALAPVLVLSVFAMGVLVLDLWAGKNKTLPFGPALSNAQSRTPEAFEDVQTIPP